MIQSESLSGENKYVKENKYLRKYHINYDRK